MAHHVVFRKGGIPVLASSPHNSAPWPYHLVVKVDDVQQRATIELQFNTSSFPGFDSEQRISLVYDADNLVPSATTLDDVDAPLPEPLFRQIARHDGRNLKTLSLVLVKPCTVRWLRKLGEIVPNHGLDDHFQHLIELAKTTTIHIVFDYAWLHPSKSALFLSLVDASKRLTGFRVDTARFREADWTVFSPGEPAPLGAPPTYEDASLKRSRESRASSPQTPTAKRLLLDPAIKFDTGSPTEKATTTTATPSPRLLSPLPPAGPFDLQDAVEAAVAKLLPEALQAVLPDMFTRMLAVPASTPPPQAPPASPNPMSPLHRLIRNRLTTHADELAKQITLDTHSHALYLRDTADVELQEHIDDHRLEFAVLKEDGLMEIHRLYDSKLQELKEHTAELVDTVEKETAEAYTTAKEKLDDFVGEQRMGLIKEMLRARRRRSEAGEGPARAKSVPLEVGW